MFVKAAARVNNRAENSHQPTREREQRTRGFRDPTRTQAFLESLGLVRQHFALKRHLLRASLYRKHLATRFSIEATQLTLFVLEELGLEAFLKTSGGKGIHVVVPLTPRVQWDDVKDFSQALVRHMASTIPARFTVVSGPRNQVGRIFNDYLRNNHGATTVVAFSTRAREGPSVSVPIRHHELAEIKGAGQCTVSNELKRLAADYEDPWKEYPEVRQSITVALRRRLNQW